MLSKPIGSRTSAAGLPASLSPNGCLPFVVLIAELPLATLPLSVGAWEALLAAPAPDGRFEAWEALLAPPAPDERSFAGDCAGFDDGG